MGNNDRYVELALESLIEDENASRQDRLNRFVDLNRLFGPQGDMLIHGGIQSQLALHELANSYVNGNYMAVVLLCQAFVEHSLSGQFVLRGEDKLAESTFKNIIDGALELEIIDAELHRELDRLRQIRNPYVHAKVGLKNGSLMKRLIEEHHIYPENMAKSDALIALNILKKFKDKHVPMWFNDEVGE